MTATAQPTCARGHRSRGVSFHSTCCLCREFKTWFPFFLLCFLSLYTCHAAVVETSEVKTCITAIQPAIEKSDAMLYTPSANYFKKNCKNKSLKCYMLELLMVIDEEAETGMYPNCINDFNARLLPDNSVGCPPCEVYPQNNITIFLRELQNLLEEINVINRT
uniref:Interleukin n=1 Tax=Tetraodon nigroviridis TaxID=99883 RepID=H3C5V2_TETNG